MRGPTDQPALRFQAAFAAGRADACIALTSHEAWLMDYLFSIAEKQEEF